ncbi:MAG: hypothetical protein LBO79_11000 [Zoogloeaceae bacterium]|jgi:hypothetical protein|nr:hypothetical protein [Zoogloeaceae bacterium]
MILIELSGKVNNENCFYLLAIVETRHVACTQRWLDKKFEQVPEVLTPKEQATIVAMPHAHCERSWRQHCFTL